MEAEPSLRYFRHLIYLTRWFSIHNPFQLGTLASTDCDVLGSTTLRYRCQVACPSTGMTMMRPRNAGIDPINRPPATIRPQTAIGPGFAVTALIEVNNAVRSPTSRSTNSGKDTTLIASASKAKRRPTPTPTAIIAQPALVVNTSQTNAAIETGGSGTRVSSYITLAASSQSRKIASSTNPSTRIAPKAGELIAPKASAQVMGMPCSRLRLISYRPTAATGPTRAKPDASGNS